MDSSKELKALLQFLRNDQLPMKRLVERFNSLFQHSVSQFQVSMTLYRLLREDLLSQVQRLCALYVLAHSWKKLPSPPQLTVSLIHPKTTSQASEPTQVTGDGEAEAVPLTEAEGTALNSYDAPTATETAHKTNTSTSAATKTIPNDATFTQLFSPFLQYMLQLLQSSDSLREKHFVATYCLPKGLLNDTLDPRPDDEKLSELSVQQWASTFDYHAATNLPNIERFEDLLSSLQTLHKESHAFGVYPFLSESALEAFSYIKLPSSPQFSSSLDSEDIHAAKSFLMDSTHFKHFLHAASPMPKSGNSSVFRPPWMRPVPPLLEPTKHELYWLSLPLRTEPIWDYTAGGGHTHCSTKESNDLAAQSSNSILGKAPQEVVSADIYTNTYTTTQLVFQAVEQPLSQQKIQFIKDNLELDPKLAHRCGISPQHLPNLAKNNPSVAATILTHLLNSSKANDFLHVLAHMEVSLPSMEVVNNLMLHKLPTDFIHLYVVNCIKSCEQLKDRYLQNRLVRLVCIFLQSLIRNKVINVQDLFVEIQTFCIEFIRIKEAGILFRTIKTFEGSLNEAES